jgi:hypothetical protein
MVGKEVLDSFARSDRKANIHRLDTFAKLAIP